MHALVWATTSTWHGMHKSSDVHNLRGKIHTYILFGNSTHTAVDCSLIGHIHAEKMHILVQGQRTLYSLETNSSYDTGNIVLDSARYLVSWLLVS